MHMIMPISIDIICRHDRVCARAGLWCPLCGRVRTHCVWAALTHGCKGSWFDTIAAPVRVQHIRVPPTLTRVHASTANLHAVARARWWYGNVMVLLGAGGGREGGGGGLLRDMMR